ncbi:MAG: 2-oxoacid:acceptor oxidoreductase subunit alpha [Candidatus Omnitrophica bacterium]|nr:2-oxoacid:acceptor oxidoreductase subunit alpha [Candidatus Omnitrophota bacterium]
MNEFSILIGGKAGFGVDKASLVITRIINRLGYRMYVYRDYPSLIRGGHTFSIIRASEKKVSAHRDNIDFMIALNQDTVDLHKIRLKESAVIIYDSDTVKPSFLPEGQLSIALSYGSVLKEENAPEITRNTCAIGSLCKAIGVPWGVLEEVVRKEFSRDADTNIKVARKGYDGTCELTTIKTLGRDAQPVISGNEAIALGLVKGGLDAYISYPMTPTSPILHFLAGIASEMSLKIIHPESEIAVILMALGFAYCGKKAAVGTSGGGFCLMTEGFSFSAMAELPVVIVLGQRPGPSTGLPTYSSQTELGFALNAGQGEFTRFVVAPGDAEEAFYWAEAALNISWKYQIPSVILSDKTLGEGTYSFEESAAGQIEEEKPLLWGRNGAYKRYLITENGVSPLTFPSDKDAIIKSNSYEHDEYGITTEDPGLTEKMQDKRLRKERWLSEELERHVSVGIYGKKGSSTAILCWGSSKGVCIEAAEELGLKVIQPLVFSPFPIRQFEEALKGVKKIIAVECNATAQLVKLINGYGLDAHEKILKYDGRPFSVEELKGKLKDKLKKVT